MNIIEILETHGYTAIQDMGRGGYRKYGVPVGGVMDEVSARLANYLVGNEDNVPLIEFAMSGPIVEFHQPVIFAVGGWFDLNFNGRRIEPWRTYFADSGDVLEVGCVKSGVYGYLAFSGGISCERVLESCSTYMKAGIGNILRSGDLLDISGKFHNLIVQSYIPEEFLPKYEDNSVRVILGPDLKSFTDRGIRTFLESEYVVTENSDRMGYRLNGPKIEHSLKGAGIITDALPLGTVEVPGDGNPIIMMVDGPTTGGYSRIGVVARVDVPKIAQTPVGNTLRFKAVDMEEAQRFLRMREISMKALKLFLKGDVRGFKVRINGEEFSVFVEEI